MRPDPESPEWMWESEKQQQKTHRIQQLSSLCSVTNNKLKLNDCELSPTHHCKHPPAAVPSHRIEPSQPTERWHGQVKQHKAWSLSAVLEHNEFYWEIYRDHHSRCHIRRFGNASFAARRQRSPQGHAVAVSHVEQSHDDDEISF